MRHAQANLERRAWRSLMYATARAVATLRTRTVAARRHRPRFDKIFEGAAVVLLLRLEVVPERMGNETDSRQGGSPN